MHYAIRWFKCKLKPPKKPNYRTSSTHTTVCQCNWPISWPPPHWPPGHAEKKNGHHIWPNYDIKNFFQKKFKCTPCPKYWTITSTLVPFEHSCKQQNVGYTDATIGCSLKQLKMGNVLKCYFKIFKSERNVPGVIGVAGVIGVIGVDGLVRSSCETQLLETDETEFRRRP